MRIQPQVFGYLWLVLQFYSFAKEVELLFDIPMPSGIIIDRVEDPNDGGIYRFGRLRHSAVSIRPEWTGINVVEDVLTPAESKMIIDLAENYAKQHGWSKGRHVDYGIRPTKDLPIRSLFPTDGEFEWLKNRFREKVWTKYNMYYGINSSLLMIDDLFITKYSADTLTSSLAPHLDKSPWSFVIGLNDNFENGGTFFTTYQRVWKGPIGSAIIFHGYQLHGAYKINKGDRYILAGFLNYGPDTHEQFMKSYDLQFDGHAAQVGFKSGDLITGISFCRAKTNKEKKMKDMGDLTQSPEQCKEGNEEEPEVIKKLKKITLKTTDEEWKRYAQSCELLLPGQNITFRVKRFVPDDEVSNKVEMEL